MVGVSVVDLTSLPPVVLKVLRGARGAVSSSSNGSQDASSVIVAFSAVRKSKAEIDDQHGLEISFIKNYVGGQQ